MARLKVTKLVEDTTQKKEFKQYKQMVCLDVDLTFLVGQLMCGIPYDNRYAKLSGLAYPFTINIKLDNGQEESIEVKEEIDEEELVDPEDD